MTKGKNLKNFLIQNKGSGETKLLKEISHQIDCHIVINRMSGIPMQFNNKGQEFHIYPERGFGKRRLPVFVDNDVILEVIEDYEKQLIEANDMKLKAYADVEDIEKKYKDELYEISSRYEQEKGGRYRIQAIQYDQERKYWKSKARTRGVIAVVAIAVCLFIIFY